jgi:hypothetical protein
VHFREGQKNLRRSLQIVLEGARNPPGGAGRSRAHFDRRAAAKPEAVSGRRTERRAVSELLTAVPDVPDHSEMPTYRYSKHSMRSR